MNKKLLVQVIFYGSIWGILEATLGHVLHFIPATIAGSIMFPIAGGILYKAYQKTESTMSLFFIGVVAALIKSVDLLLPGLPIFKTINPMISILFESLVVVAVMSLLLSKKPALKFSAFPIASISWRLLFVGWMFFLHTTQGLNVPFIGNMSATVQFVVVQGLLSGAIASLFIFVLDRIKVKLPEYNQNIIFAASLLIAAIITTYTL